jgi:hypothetical protein
MRWGIANLVKVKFSSFLFLWFSGKYGKADSARMAGYKGKSVSALINQANWVLKKYE